MTDNRTYTRYDADSDVDSHQMTHFDPYAELAARTQQLAEAMSLCAQIEAKLADVQSALSLSEHLWQQQAQELDRLRAERQKLLNANVKLFNENNGLRAERDSYQARYETINANHAERYGELQRVTAERDAANRRADDAVAAYHVIAARMGGMGWWC